MRKHLGRAAAWLVTAGLLIFLFNSIKFADVVAATKTAEPWTVPGILACIIVIYFADSFATWKTFNWFLAVPFFGVGFGAFLLWRGKRRADATLSERQRRRVPLTE